MAGPLMRRFQVMTAEVETTVGTAETPAAADGVLKAWDVEFQADIEMIARQGQGSGSPVTASPGALAGSATFKHELYGGSSAPAWASTLLPACGLGLTSLTFAPDSRAPEATSSKTKALTLSTNVNGLFKVLHGAMGNAVFRFIAGQPAWVEFDMKGVYNAYTDASALTPTYPTTAPLRFASAGLTIGSFSPVVKEMTIDLKNTVHVRESGNGATGLHSAVIDNMRREITVNLIMEATLVADYNPWADKIARTERAFGFALGTAGNQLTFAAPKLQVMDIRNIERNGIQCIDVTAVCNRSAAAGEDEFTIVSA